MKMYKKYSVELNTITPLHIGNGEEYTFVDYFIEGGFANIFDIDSVFESIRDVNLIDQLSRDIEESIVNGQAQINVKDFFKKYGVDVSKHVIKKVKTDVEPSRKVRVKKHINQNGRYYIPGSSIKGAIRTAYIFDYFDRNINELVEVLNDRKIGSYQKFEPVEVLNDREIRLDQKFSKINEIAIGKIHDYFFRHLIVSDSEFIDDQKMSIIKTIRYNNRYNNKKRRSGNPIYLEAIDANVSINFKIKINDGFGKTIDDLKKDIIKLSETVSNYEKDNSKNPDFLKEFYGKLSNDIKSNTVYMNIGFGGGYLPKTIYLLLWKHKKDINLIKGLLPQKSDKKRINMFEDFPRTRTIYNNQPIGWIKLNFKSE